MKCVNLLPLLLSVQKSFRWKVCTLHFIFTLDFFFLYVLNRDDTFYGWANSAIMESSVIHFCVHSFVSGGIILPGLVETKHRKNTRIWRHWPVILKCRAQIGYFAESNIGSSFYFRYPFINQQNIVEIILHPLPHCTTMVFNHAWRTIVPPMLSSYSSLYLFQLTEWIIVCCSIVGTKISLSYIDWNWYAVHKLLFNCQEMK